MVGKGLEGIEADFWGGGETVVPQYAPSAAYRQLEFMLGRIGSLTERGSFTTQSGDYGNG